MKTHFYDIESLTNVFSLCNFKPEENTADIYLLCDDMSLMAVPDFAKELLDRIHKANYNFNGTIALYDLHEEASQRHLAMEFGLSDADRVNMLPGKRKDSSENISTYGDDLRPVCDTDPDYDPDKHPYLLGYNSYNYDTTMLASYLYDAFYDHNFRAYTPPTAKSMREMNDTLFLPMFKSQMPRALTQRYNPSRATWSHPDYNDGRYIIRRNMLMTGRHIDVARLNEKQQKVGLKRLLGMLGCQILESSKLSAGLDHIDTTEQLYDLLAYNMSDCINLKTLFDHPVYSNAFELKKGLLQTYPELVYEQRSDSYAPLISPDHVRRDRLMIDSSSAQFATKSLCPYGHLTDIPAVSFMYPSERKAKELGIPRVNVLDEAKKFFYGLYDKPELRAQFDKIYNYYKTIEGKNFNDSENYKKDYPNGAYAYNLADMPKTDTCLHYFDADGNPTSCFVTFSTGGIHGAECNTELFASDHAKWEKAMADMTFVQSQYPVPEDLKKAKRIETPDGVDHPASHFLKAGSTMKKSFYKDIASKEPLLFKEDDNGATKLNPKYVFTSADPTNHEDFTSYYPNLLRMMEAFFNEGLGYDRYGEVFDQKSKYGKLMKQKGISDEERNHYNILRNGVKLILNSASGAGDTNFESNIRMNNQIISMRIIGQLYTWRIAQAQSYQGARITSTNTDGLYSVLEETLNNAILEKESASIHVDIEPEPTYLISKDSNNRIEFNVADDKIESASGGTLACHKGPDPTKSLAHPAVIDWAMCEYLIVAAMGYKDMSLDKPFDREIGMSILRSTIKKWDPVKWLIMFQNVIASSPGSINYIYGVDPKNPAKTTVLQHYNRVYILKDNTPDTVHLFAANGRQITPAMKKKRERDKEPPVQHDATARRILRQNGVASMPPDREAVTKKVTNIESEWFMFVQNRALPSLSNDEKLFIMSNIDFDKYLKLLEDCFEKNWRNKLPDADANDNKTDE